ncbi:ATP-binding cassette domain-containing protein [Actinokineospora sp. 24-640]
MADIMIEADRITKSFGSVSALSEVSLAVPQGTVLGLLGHNGAGKTTLVNVLTTLLEPTSGTARVAGFDVSRDAQIVRSRIGLTGQYASVDEDLPGRHNLVLIARLLGAGRREAGERADELLEVFGLTDAAKRIAKTYSGGMRRRLDLAASLVGRPGVIFLDEPTTGLDPASRLGMWEIVENLVAGGATVLLTTQYLDEADRLADAITILSEGKVIASGTTTQLKNDVVGQRTVTVTLAVADDHDTAVGALTRAGLNSTYDQGRNAVTAAVAESAQLATVVRALDEVDVAVAELALAEPTLDDVYLALTRQAQADARAAA